MTIEFSQILIIIFIFLVFGTLIAIVNLRAKKKEPVNKEQMTWQNIEDLNTRKKEVLENKKELSYMYTARSVDEALYAKKLKEMNEELTKLNLKINEEVSKLTTLQKKENPEEELRFKNLKIKGDLNELATENTTLKERILDLEDFIKSMSKQTENKTSQDDKNKLKYYELVIKKYKDLIVENEKITISQLRGRVNPSDLTIKSIVSRHSPIAYDFNKDYINTLRKIYNFLRSEIYVVKENLKISFWMDFSKVFTEKVCDEQVIAVILCSIMQSMQDSLASVESVMLEDDSIHLFVTTKVKDTYYIFDLAQKTPFDTYKNTDINKLYADYKFEGKKISRHIFSYNQSDYRDYS